MKIFFILTASFLFLYYKSKSKKRGEPSERETQMCFYDFDNKGNVFPREVSCEVNYPKQEF